MKGKKLPKFPCLDCDDACACDRPKEWVEEFDRGNLQILCMDRARTKNQKDQREYVNYRRNEKCPKQEKT